MGWSHSCRRCPISRTLAWKKAHLSGFRCSPACLNLPSTPLTFTKCWWKVFRTMAMSSRYTKHVDYSSPANTKSIRRWALHQPSGVTLILNKLYRLSSPDICPILSLVNNHSPCLVWWTMWSLRVCPVCHNFWEWGMHLCALCLW